LEFIAKLSGWYWPCSADLRRARRRGKPAFDWKNAWEERQRDGAEYFVITPAEELTMQPGIAKLLSGFSLISSSPKYVVYDLRQKP
jgi:hypothetical protein